MPANIKENEFSCFRRESDGVIPYWIKSLDIDECNNNIVVHFNSDKYFQCLSERIAFHEFCSETDEVTPDTYETKKDPDLNTISFIGNLYNALHFIISHDAISEDTYKRSVAYLKSCSYKQGDIIKTCSPTKIMNTDPLNDKFEEIKEISKNKLCQSSLNIPSCLFSQPKDLPSTSSEINLESNTLSF